MIELSPTPRRRPTIDLRDLTEEQRADRAIEQFRRRYIETSYPDAAAVAIGIGALERSTERVLRALYRLPTPEQATPRQLDLLGDTVELADGNGQTWMVPARDPGKASTL